MPIPQDLAGSGSAARRPGPALATALAVLRAAWRVFGALAAITALRDAVGGILGQAKCRESGQKRSGVADCVFHRDGVDGEKVPLSSGGVCLKRQRFDASNA